MGEAQSAVRPARAKIILSVPSLDINQTLLVMETNATCQAHVAKVTLQ